MERYIKPKISIIEIKLEQGILAGSAIIIPNDPDGKIIEQWDNEIITEDTFKW